MATEIELKFRIPPGRLAALRRALAAGVISESHIRAELGDVLCARHPGRGSAEEITLYKSLGFGGLDLAALELALQVAEAQDLGTVVEWAS